MPGKAPPFSVRADRAMGILHLKVWDFWQDAEAEAYLALIKKGFAEIAETKAPWGVLADCTNFPAQSTKTQAVLAKTMELAVKHGMLKAANIVNSSVSESQLKRLNESEDVSSMFFTDATEATQWLRKQLDSARG
jgi:hypothetical protein